jgi:hypothetical protein
MYKTNLAVSDGLKKAGRVQKLTQIVNDNMTIKK